MGFFIPINDNCWCKIYYWYKLIIFSPITAQREQQLIESAIQSFQFLSCLKFKTWDGDPDKDYLHFQNSKARPGWVTVVYSGLKFVQFISKNLMMLDFEEIILAWNYVYLKNPNGKFVFSNFLHIFGHVSIIFP